LLQFKLNISTMNHTEEANQESHYILLVVAIIIGITGVYLRFADFHYSSIIANIILIAGVALALKGIFAILK
jgi:cytochrome b subunit of formate dehydrogenase